MSHQQATALEYEIINEFVEFELQKMASFKHTMTTRFFLCFTHQFINSNVYKQFN